MDGQTVKIIEHDEATLTQHGKPEVAHIIERRHPDETAPGRVMSAFIEGTPLTAICGAVFVPSRNPNKLPICPACEELYFMARDLSS